jgi:signal transduction histidine kinase
VNLLTNALKFTLETGSISLKADTDDEGRVTIVVQDTGVGMDPVNIPSALSQFGRVEDETCAGLQGAGLGLPLVSALAERHGGSFTLESEKGKGTTATIALPAGRRIRAKTAA